MLTSIIRQLPQLTQQELKTLKAAIDELSHNQPCTGVPALYDVFGQVLGTVPPFSVFQASGAYRPFMRHVDGITTFMLKYFSEANKLQRIALMTFVVRALIADLKGRGVPITVGTLVKNLGRFEQVFSSEFPNYLESGLAPMILKALKEK